MGTTAVGFDSTVAEDVLYLIIYRIKREIFDFNVCYRECDPANY